MAIGAAIAGGIATAAAGSLLSRGGGGSKALKKFKPIGINAGGITAGLSRLPGESREVPVFGFDSTGPKGRRRVQTGTRTVTDTGPKVIDLTTSEERQGLISDQQALLRGAADEVSALRDEALSGLGILGEARQARIESARRRAVGNLREGLARRRVLGSSFGQDAITRAEREFAQQAGEAEAQTALQQLEIKRNLIDREFTLRSQAVQTGLNELNFQAKLAASLATGATNALQATAQAQATLAAERAAGQGELLGTLGGIFLEDALNSNTEG